MLLLDINSWWQGMDLFEKILWVIALLFSTLFLFQTVFSLAGGSDMDAPDAIGDADDFVSDDQGVGSQYFTIKNLIAFFTMFGWVGIAAYNSGQSKGVAMLLAVGAGSVMVFLMVLLLRNVNKLRYSGTMQIKNALNQVGNVYLTIPAQRKGAGKVHVSVQGSLHELDAITDDTTDISTGSVVKVTGIVGESVLLVSKV
jgi:membrane protein implicated in regulation of membrane protease activity